MERQRDVSRSASRADRKLSEQTQLPAEDDFLPDVKGGILDLRPPQQGKRWNLSDRKDQHGILWLIRKKRPKLVIGYGRCILFCTVLCCLTPGLIAWQGVKYALKLNCRRLC